MPGPPGGGQRFLPQVPFGLGLDPQRGLAGSLPPTIPTDPIPEPPIPGYVRQYAQGAGLQRRFVRPIIVAEPVLTTKFVAPPPFVANQALERSQTRRGAPKPHLAPPATPTFVAPPAMVVGEGPAERIRRRRYLYSAIVAPPLVAPTGGYPLTPPGTFVGLGPSERIRRRRYLYQTIVAPPVVATPFIAPAATIVSNHFLLRHGHRLPPQTILPPPPAFLAPQARYANFVGLGAVASAHRRRNGSVLVAPPVPATPFVAPAATNVSQAVERSVRRRSGSVQFPRLGSPPPVKSGTFVAQAVPRALTRRAVPRPHLASPVPPTAAFVAPAALLVAEQSGARPYTRRSAPALHLPRLGAPKPVPAGTFLNQALRRPTLGRTVPRPHLAAPVVTPVAVFVAPLATVVTDQSVARAFTRRTVPAPHLPKLGAAKPLPAGDFNYQAIGRAQRRSTSRRLSNGPQLPAPTGPPSATYGTYVYQAVRRPFTRRQVFPTRVALPVVTPAGPPPVLEALWASLTIWHLTGPDRRYFRVQKPRLARPVTTPPVFVAPSATIVSQAPERGVRRRSGAVRLPRLGARSPVLEGTFLSQALRRPYVGRATPEPHLAPALVSQPAAFIAPAPTIVSQAVRRAVLRRSGSVRLPSRGASGPVPEGTFVLQALRRPYVGRSPLRPRFASAIVAPVPFFAPPALIVSQGTERGWEARYRTVPAPHLAAPVRTPAGPGATLRLQAVTGRALLGRGGHVRLPSLGAPRPVRSGTFLSQALRRPYVGRTVPRPHLAAGLVTQQVFPPNAPGLFVSQATQRASSPLSRRGHVRLAPPVLTRGRTPPTLVVSQSLLRPYVGRRIIPAHLAPPVRTKAGPGARLVYQAVQRPRTRRSVPLRPRVPPGIVGPRRVFPPNPPGLFLSQAVQRALTRRRVPVPPRYLSIVFIPSQTVIAPFPVITTTGVTAPLAPGGTTSPSSRTGQTSPREHLP